MENTDLKSIVKQRYARAALGVTPFESARACRGRDASEFLADHRVEASTIGPQRDGSQMRAFIRALQPAPAAVPAHQDEEKTCCAFGCWA
ncbi:MAG: hypothetical protein IT513_02860 [Burkholderiales bacterium]|nr:hypothetical protein [Burkholderiales bacterium]